MDCTTFIENYSEYRDGVLSDVEGRQLREHADFCSRCARYDRVISGGVGVLKSFPAPELSEDFLPRLQFRLYALEERRRRMRAYARRATVAGIFVLAGAAGMGVGTLLRPASSVHELPPVAALAPQRAVEVPLLFRTGPLLTPTPVRSDAGWSGATDLFWRYPSAGTGLHGNIQVISIK
jgi:hypothetical protein